MDVSAVTMETELLDEASNARCAAVSERDSYCFHAGDVFCGGGCLSAFEGQCPSSCQGITWHTDTWNSPQCQNIRENVELNAKNKLN